VPVRGGGARLTLDGREESLSPPAVVNLAAPAALLAGRTATALSAGVRSGAAGRARRAPLRDPP